MRALLGNCAFVAGLAAALPVAADGVAAPATPVQRFDSVLALAEWALAEGDPLVLIGTARASLALGVRMGVADDPADPFSPAALLAAAEELGAGDPVVATLVASTLAEAPKGIVQGLTRIDWLLGPGESLPLTYVAGAGEIADVVIRLKANEPGADLDVRVFDEAGNAVTWDEGTTTGVFGNSAYVQWTPTHCAVFTVEVVNRGTAPAGFLLVAAPSRPGECPGMPALGVPTAMPAPVGP